MSFSIPALLSPEHVIFGSVTLLVLLLFRRRGISGQSLPYPPGPRPLPIIGNLLDMPQSKFTITWTTFGEKYGPLTWLTIPGQNLLIINSLEAAKELLEKRALIFIDRPRLVMLRELLGLGSYLAFSTYDETWRKQRAHLKVPLSASVVKRDYSALLEVKAREYLERCFVRPETFLTEIKRIVAEANIKLTYGRLEDEGGLDYIQLNAHILEFITQGLQGYVVDLLPALQYLPGWLPGMKFKRDAARWKQEISDLEHIVSKSAKKSMLSDDPEVRPSFIFKKLQEFQEKYEEGMDVQQQIEDEMAITRSGLSLFLAGVETIQTTIESFTRAMTLFSSVQKRAQEEIDNVVGPGRFPTFEDQPNLPYLHAVVLETLRWNPVVPSGVPHASRNDDTYAGYFIPQGTSVIVNLWGLSRDSKYYPNPRLFDPERYLKQPPELDPREYFFGFGRRICPGKALAFQQVWIMAASVLWAYQLVGSKEDPTASGEDMDCFSFEVLNRPLPFRCQFVPRREGLKDKLGLSSA